MRAGMAAAAAKKKPRTFQVRGEGEKLQAF
jgi:hypothetical protein